MPNIIGLTNSSYIEPQTHNKTYTNIVYSQRVPILDLKNNMKVAKR